MRAQKHDLLRPLAADNIGDHVARRRVGHIARLYHQMQPHRQAHGVHTLDLIGVRRRHRSGRNLPHAVLVTHLSRMRQPVVIRAHRANDDGERPASRRLDRTLAPLAHRGAIPGTVLRGRHAIVDENDLAGVSVRRRGEKIVERRHERDRRRDPAPRRRDRPPQRHDGKLLRQPRPNDARRRRPAHPAVERKRLDAHARELEPLERTNRPITRRGFALRARKPRPHLRRQRFHERVGDAPGRVRRRRRRRNINRGTRRQTDKQNPNTNPKCRAHPAPQSHPAAPRKRHFHPRHKAGPTPRDRPPPRCCALNLKSVCSATSKDRGPIFRLHEKKPP